MFDVTLLKKPPRHRRFEMLKPDVKSEPILCFDGNHVRSLRGKAKEDCCCVAILAWNERYHFCASAKHWSEQGMLKATEQYHFWKRYLKERKRR